MDEDKEITAVFEKEEYELAIKVEGDGVVEIDPDQEKYHYGGEVTLTAVPDDGWEFKEWIVGDKVIGSTDEPIAL